MQEAGADDLLRACQAAPRFGENAKALILKALTNADDEDEEVPAQPTPRNGVQSWIGVVLFTVSRRGGADAVQPTRATAGRCSLPLALPTPSRAAQARWKARRRSGRRWHGQRSIWRPCLQRSGRWWPTLPEPKSHGCPGEPGGQGVSHGS